MRKIIVFRGKAGAGKTTVSDEVSSIIHTPVWRKDDVYDALVEEVSDHQKRNIICEKVLQNTILSTLKTGNDLIIDHSCHHPEHYISLKQWVNHNDGQWISIVVTCSDRSLWAERISSRSIHPQPNQWITDFEQLETYYGSMEVDPFPEELLIDTCLELKSNVSRILDFLYH